MPGICCEVVGHDPILRRLEILVLCRMINPLHDVIRDGCLLEVKKARLALSKPQEEDSSTPARM